MFAEWFWALPVIGGPIVLGLVLAWLSWRRRRGRSRAEVMESQTERLARMDRQGR